MKKLFALLVCIALAAIGCGKGKADSSAKSDDKERSAAGDVGKPDDPNRADEALQAEADDEDQEEERDEAEPDDPE
jgi:hypothetical protein